MKTIIIDDEEKSRKIIYNYINSYCSNVEIVAQADSVASAYKAITELKPELILLDINMLDGTGFDLLNKFEKLNFKIIFITAYEEYAIKAFKFSALDYLLKPVNPQELIDSIQKAHRVIDFEALEVKYKTFLANYNPQIKADKKLVLKTAESIHVIEVKDIIRLEADGSYSNIYINDGRKIMVSKNLKEYEELLTNYNFFRPHHSHLVNLNFIQSFEKRDGGTLIMKDKTAIPVATRRKDDLMRLFDEA